MKSVQSVDAVPDVLVIHVANTLQCRQLQSAVAAERQATTRDGGIVAPLRSINPFSQQRHLAFGETYAVLDAMYAKNDEIGRGHDWESSDWTGNNECYIVGSIYTPVYHRQRP